jgi:hypothetical protein
MDTNFSMLRKVIFIMSLIFSSVYTLTGQTGIIEGIATDKKTGEVLPGVMVTLEGTTVGASASIDGKFIITNVKPGKYKVKASYISFDPVVFENIELTAGKTTSVPVIMSENTVALEEVAITGVKKTNTDVAMINTTRMSPLVSIGISGQQILRSQDRDASEVIKRLTGTTIIDDRFIVV